MISLRERIAHGGTQFTALHASYESYNTAVSCARMDRVCLAISHYEAAIELQLN